MNEYWLLKRRIPGLSEVYLKVVCYAMEMSPWSSPKQNPLSNAVQRRDSKFLSAQESQVRTKFCKI
jgi:hypothetical protein